MKNRINKFTMFLITFIFFAVIFTGNVYSQTVDNVGQNDTEEQTGEVVETENVTTSDSSDKTEEDTSKVKPSVAPYASDVFASYDGTDLTGVNTLTGTKYVDATTSKTLTVIQQFSNANVEKKVVIDIKEGFALAGGPGIVASGTNSWVMDKTKLPEQLQPIIKDITYTQNAKTYNYQGKGGTLTYTTYGTVSKVELDISIRLDSAFLLGDHTVKISNGLIVTASENNIQLNTEKLDVINVTGTVNTQYFNWGKPREFILKPGQSVASPGEMIFRSSDFINFYKDNYIAEEAKYYYKIPKDMGIQNATFKLNGVALTSTNFKSEVDTTSAGAGFDYLILTFSKTNLSLGAYEFNFTVPKTAANGKYIMKLDVAKSYVIAYGSTLKSSVLDGASISIEVSDSNKDNLVISQLTSNAINVDNSEREIVPLGGFNLSNISVNDALDKKIKFIFNDPSIGVTNLNVPLITGGTGQIKNLVIKTTKNNIITKTNLNSPQVYNGTRLANLLTIDIYSLGITAKDEFIKEITYEQDIIQAGLYGQPNFSGQEEPLTSFYKAPIQYNGKILSIPANKITYGELYIVDKNLEFSDASVLYLKNETKINLVNSTSNIIFRGGINTTASVLGGTNHPFIVEYIINGQKYNINQVSAWKGFNVYLREDQFFTFSKSDISVKSGTKDFTVGNGLTITEGVDNKGYKVYKLSLPTLILEPSAKLSISGNMKIKSTSPTADVNLSEIVKIEAIGIAGNNSDINIASWNNVDTFNVDGSGNTNKIYGTTAINQKLSITKQQSFTVATAAKLGQNGSWVSYDHETKKEVINLNPASESFYQLDVTNNSGQAVQGYTALVPIPKFNEATNKMPATPSGFDPAAHIQAEKFGWTASLRTQVVPESLSGLAYIVTYSTTYETNKDSANFKAWSAIANKDDIRMIKIMTTNSIADGIKDTIEIPLVLSDTAADSHAGNTNIYSSYIYREIAGIAAYRVSEPVALRLKTGVVKGLVFNDLNRNGKQDSGELGRNGVSVSAYEKTSGKFIESVVTKTIGGVAGRYEFMGLEKTVPVNIVFDNPTIDGTTRFSPVTTGGSSAVMDTAKAKGTVSNITPSSGVDIIAGLITPVIVSINPQGGEVAQATYNIYPGEKIMSEPTTERIGYTFNGYSLTATGAKVTFPYTVSQTTNFTLYALYTVNKYDVSFDVTTNGATSVAPTLQNLTFNTLVTAPANPSKTGYTFAGWFDAATAGNKWDFATSKVPAKNLKLFAQFTVNKNTVNYVVDGANVMSVPNVAYGTKFTNAVSTNPSKIGNSFDGWYNGSTKWDFASNSMINGTLTLTAKFTISKYDISFDVATNGATSAVPATQNLAYDTLVTAPGNPTKTGYTFTGWFDAATAGNKWNFATNKVPANNVKLFAQFTVNKNTVNYVVDGTNVKSVPNVDYGSKFANAVSTNPSKVGYTFGGWYNGTSKWDFTTNTMINGTLTLTAKFTINKYTISFDINGATTTAIASINADYNSTINLTTLKPIPYKFGYEFIGWKDKAGTILTSSFIVKAANETLTAEYKDLVATGVWTIDATDFVISEKDLKASIKANTLQADILTRSKAKAKNTATNTDLTPLTVSGLSSIDGTNLVDSYNLGAVYANPITRVIFGLFSPRGLNDLTKQFKMKVVKDNVVIKDGIVISANNFSINATEAAALTEGSVKTYSAVTAYTESGLTPITTISVSAAQLSAINNADVKGGGIYSLTFVASNSGKTASKTITVVVKGSNVNSDNSIVINANGFDLEQGDLASFDKVSAIAKAKAKSFILSNDVPVADIVVNDTQLNAIKNATVDGGVFDLTFTATAMVDGVQKSTSVVIKVNVAKFIVIDTNFKLVDNFKDDDGVVVIYRTGVTNEATQLSSDYTVDIQVSGKTLTDDQLKNVTYSVKAVGGFDNTKTYVEVVNGTNKIIAKKSGVVEITGTYNGLSSTITVVIPGDLTRDSRLNSLDTLNIQAYLLDKDKNISKLGVVDEYTLLLADMNGDGKIISSDKAFLQKMIFKAITPSN